MLSIIEYHAYNSQFSVFLAVSNLLNSSQSMLPIVFTSTNGCHLECKHHSSSLTRHILLNRILCANWSSGSGSCLEMTQIISHIAVIVRFPTFASKQKCNQWSGLQSQDSKIYLRRHFAASKHKQICIKIMLLLSDKRRRDENACINKLNKISPTQSD